MEYSDQQSRIEQLERRITALEASHDGMFRAMARLTSVTVGPSMLLAMANLALKQEEGIVTLLERFEADVVKGAGPTLAEYFDAIKSIAPEKFRGKDLGEALLPFLRAGSKYKHLLKHLETLGVGDVASGLYPHDGAAGGTDSV